MAKEILVRIEDGRGTLVRVASGSVWVTEEGDPRDRFVAAGDRHLIASEGVTLISALTRSTISLTAPRRRSFAERLLKLWSNWFVPSARPTTARGEGAGQGVHLSTTMQQAAASLEIA